MRARHRHFNPRDAGAKLALDSRFISGLSDGDPVSTWTDKSTTGTNVTQSGALRPTIEFSEQGGNPVVRFNGSNSLTGSAANLITGSNSRMLFVLAKKSNTNNIDVLYGWGSATAGQNFGFYGLDNEIVTAWLWNEGDFNTSLSCASPTILALTYDGSTTRSYGNGAAGGTSGSSVNTGTTYLHVGQNASNGGNKLTGDLMQIIVIPGESSSLRRRIEHHAAFSFKIACS
jgi:hypothetical protein